MSRRLAPDAGRRSDEDSPGHVLLLVGRRSYRVRAFLTAIRAAGLEAVVVSDQVSAVAGFAGRHALAVDPQSPERALERVIDHVVAHGLYVRAVMAPDDDMAVLAALVAQALGLPGHPVAAVRVAGDKLATRQACTARDHTSASVCFQALPASVAARVALAQELVYPCVIKPSRLAAGLGVIRADDPADFLAQAERATAIAERFTPPCERARPPLLLVEGFIPGAEVIVEAVVCAGRFHVLAILDKPDAGAGPAFPETLLITPSRLPPADIRAAVRVAEASVHAVGLSHGPVHVEVRVHHGRAVLIELAARSIGGLCSPIIALSSGQSLESLILDVALAPNEHVPVPTAAPGSRGVMMVPAPRAGILERIMGADKARAVPHIQDLVLSAAPGARVAPAPDSDRYLGFLFAAADTPDLVEQALRGAHDCLEVVVTAQA